MQRMIKKIILPVCSMAIYCCCTAQNNAIFKGGNNDGWNSVNIIQGSSNIFHGGNGDGWNSMNYIQGAANIFHGGNADGWSSMNFVQSNKNIFAGGSADGWSSLNTVQSSTNIFWGGPGDGWASTYRPQGPLPVSLLYFTATKNNASSSLVKWETTQETNTAYFDVERSSDAIIFAKIGTTAAAGNSSAPVNYVFIDHDPQPGINYYRLKQVDLDGHFVYSPARSVRFDELNALTVKYYPNPNKGLLNIELSTANAAEARVINIISETGVPVNQLRIHGSAGSRMQVDLSHYAKGVYFIQLRTATLNSTERIILE